MLCNPAIRNMIRESKTHQIDSVILSCASEGMIGMDASLLRLYQQGTIDEEQAVSHSISPDLLRKKNSCDSRKMRPICAIPVANPVFFIFVYDIMHKKY